MNIKPNMNCKLIAEIGINHNGSLELTKTMIDMAKDYNCYAVKFQKRDIDTVYTKATLDAPRESPWGTTQREQKQGLEFGQKEYEWIDNYCKEVGIEWFASAWDLKSQKFLQKFNCKDNKIASAMLTYEPLLEEVANEGKHTYISTGMATYEDIEKAVKIFKSKNCPFTLMHTVSVYPCKETETNISMMIRLKEKFQCPVGYSGHESGVLPSLLAIAYGAEAVERHITIDRSMYGSDQSASLESRGLEIISKFIEGAPLAFGNGEKVFSNQEKEVAKKLRWFQTV